MTPTVTSDPRDAHDVVEREPEIRAIDAALAAAPSGESTPDPGG